MITMGRLKATQGGIFGVLSKGRTALRENVSKTATHATQLITQDNSYLRRMGLRAKEINKASKHWFA